MTKFFNLKNAFGGITSISIEPKEDKFNACITVRFGKQVKNTQKVFPKSEMDSYIDYLLGLGAVEIFNNINIAR